MPYASYFVAMPVLNFQDIQYGVRITTLKITASKKIPFPVRQTAMLALGACLSDIFNYRIHLGRYIKSVMNIKML
jgi:hypothetical protein